MVPVIFRVRRRGRFIAMRLFRPPLAVSRDGDNRTTDVAALMGRRETPSRGGRARLLGVEPDPLGRGAGQYALPRRVGEVRHRGGRALRVAVRPCVRDRRPCSSTAGAPLSETAGEDESSVRTITGKGARRSPGPARAWRAIRCRLPLTPRERHRASKSPVWSSRNRLSPARRKVVSSPRASQIATKENIHSESSEANHSSTWENRVTLLWSFANA